MAISGTDFQPGATVSLGGAAATSVTYLSATTLFAFTPIHVAGAVTVTVTNPDLQAGSLASAFTYMCIWSPMAFNGGAYCVGETISIWTPLVFGATYSWTGPNGFTSSEQNPTIPSATATNAGTYSVTVTVAGCISVPGTTEVVVGPSPPVITAPVTVGQGSPNRLAGVVTHAGSTYAWTITNGTITAGQGTSQVAFTAGAAGTPLTLSVAETNGSGCTSAPATATVTVAPPGSAVLFYTVAPCRQLDTRTGSGTPIAAGGTQTVVMTGTPCGIPATAKAVSVNLTVTEPTAPGYLTIYPADGTQPLISNVNFTAGQTRANNAQLRLSTDGAGAVKVFNGSLGTVHVILDVNGYFQ